TCARFSGTLAGSPGTEGARAFFPVPVKGGVQVCLAARRIVRLSSGLLALLRTAHAALRTEPTEETAWLRACALGAPLYPLCAQSRRDLGNRKPQGHDDQDRNLPGQDD